MFELHKIREIKLSFYLQIFILILTCNVCAQTCKLIMINSALVRTYIDLPVFGWIRNGTTPSEYAA